MDGTLSLLLIVASVLLAGLFAYLYIKKTAQLKGLAARFKDVIDVDEEKNRVEAEIKLLNERRAALESEFEAKTQQLRSDYQAKKAIYDALVKEINVLEEDLEFISCGLYKPHFDYDSSEAYKTAMTEVRQKQKAMVKDKKAAVCPLEWEVGGSKREGRKMTNRYIKLMLRAFNNECDSATLKVKWNNVERMEQRIEKAHDAINKLGEVHHVDITTPYLTLRLQELYLAHEYQEKRHEEKEEQRRIREMMREEEKVQKEIEKAKREAEQEESTYQEALEQAKKELEGAQGEELRKMQEQMAKLEQQLKEAQEKKERAMSRAQMTKSGHVYVISNIGSFGEDVYKIGLTRRLEPVDRVKELGDASVPFAFDIHAMIYSEDAPDLENRLQKTFHDRRLNLVNSRKEFFSVSLEEIEEVVKKNHGEIEFMKLVEAREYRESTALRERRLEEQKMLEEERFPESI